MASVSRGRGTMSVCPVRQGGSRRRCRARGRRRMGMPALLGAMRGAGAIRPRAMMRLSRSGTSETWREAEDGSEILYELEWVWRPRRPATYWEPADGGLYVECWRLDGRWIWEAD